MTQPESREEMRALLRVALLDATRTLRRHVELQANLGADGYPAATGMDAPAPSRPAAASPTQRKPAPVSRASAPDHTPKPEVTSASRAREAFEAQTGGTPARRTSPAAAKAPVAAVDTTASTLDAFRKLATHTGPTPLAEIPPGERPASLEAVREELGACTRCKLHRGRNNIVFGVGNPAADIMFVGEGPGADEDAQGEPFVGNAGQLLTKIIGAMGIGREDVYIANIVKCRPPRNRDPEPDEVAMCEPFLTKQILVVQPKVIVTLGRVAAHALLRVRTPITRLRGQWKDYRGIPVMPTLHPAYLLRHPPAKRAVWEDIQTVMVRAGLSRPK